MPAPVSYNFIPDDKIQLVREAIRQAENYMKALEKVGIDKDDISNVRRALRDQSQFENNLALKAKALQLLVIGAERGGVSLAEKTKRSPAEVQEFVRGLSQRNSFDADRFYSSYLQKSFRTGTFRGTGNPLSKSHQPTEAPSGTVESMLIDWWRENLNKQIPLNSLLEEELWRIQVAFGLQGWAEKSPREELLRAMVGDLESVRSASFDLYVNSERGRALVEMARQELASIEIRHSSTETSPLVEERRPVAESKLEESKAEEPTREELRSELSGLGR